METKFERVGFGDRLKSMLKVDMRRMFTLPLFYICAGISLVVPILILVMTLMMDGNVTVDPNTGAETITEGFKNVWQIIGAISGESSAAPMDMTSMCNINMLYFGVAIFVSLFVSEDFRSGYAKNLFTVRAKKNDYVISKTLVGVISGMAMILCFFIGAMTGGAIAGLSFDAGTASAAGIVMCLLSKMFLVGVFVALALIAAVIAKQRTWISIIGSCAVCMLLFMMIPMLAPLNASILNVVMCLAGGTLFSVGLGLISNVILKKTSLV